MQTFVPSDKSFDECARILDRMRLGKQRIETMQILNTLTGVSDGWRNHPAVKMWRGHEYGLAIYGWYICDEWLRRGYEDRMQYLFERFIGVRDFRQEDYYPRWWGDNRVHSSHRAALLYKLPSYYSRYGWTEEPQLNYYWPRYADQATP